MKKSLFTTSFEIWGKARSLSPQIRWLNNPDVGKTLICDWILNSVTSHMQSHLWFGSHIYHIDHIEFQ